MLGLPMHLAELATKQRLVRVVAAAFHIRVRVVAALAGGAPRPWCDLWAHVALQLRRRCGLWTPQALAAASADERAVAVQRAAGPS